MYLGRLLFNTINNLILIETGIAQMEWPLYFIYGQRRWNEVTVLDNFYIYQKKVGTSNPGSSKSQKVKYYPLINDTDERKWNMNF